MQDSKSEELGKWSPQFSTKATPLSNWQPSPPPYHWLRNLLWSFFSLKNTIHKRARARNPHLIAQSPCSTFTIKHNPTHLFNCDSKKHFYKLQNQSIFNYFPISSMSYRVIFSLVSPRKVLTFTNFYFKEKLDTNKLCMKPVLPLSAPFLWRRLPPCERPSPSPASARACKIYCIFGRNLELFWVKGHFFTIGRNQFHTFLGETSEKNHPILDFCFVRLSHSVELL